MPMNELTTQDFSGGGNSYYDDLSPNNYETTMGRGEYLGETSAMTSGTVVYSYFSAQRTRSVAGAAVYTGATAAATVTTIKYGLYEVTGAAAGDLTLRAVTANDAALLAAADTRYFKAFTSAWTIKSGRRYALAVIVVATTPPTLVGTPTPAAVNVGINAINTLEPRRAAQNASETDLTASVLVGALAATDIHFYGELGAS